MSEADEISSFYVDIEVKDAEGNAAKLSVNPTGQFNGGGCQAIAYYRPERILEAADAEALYQVLTKGIEFEEIEGTLDPEPEDYQLSTMLEFAKGLDETEDNSWWLRYFKRLVTKAEEFHAALNEMKEIETVTVHQVHNACGDLCDFADYTNAPEGEEEDTIRQFLEDTLTPDSAIDDLMDCLDDGYFELSQYQSDKVLIADRKNGTVKELFTVTDVR